MKREDVIWLAGLLEGGTMMVGLDPYAEPTVRDLQPEFLSPCDCCGEQRLIIWIDNGYDETAVCQDCHDALTEAWQSLTPEQQEEERRLIADTGLAPRARAAYREGFTGRIWE